MFREMKVQKYRRKQCYQLCQQDFILDVCGCLNPEFPILEKNNDNAICNLNWDAIICAKVNLTNFPFSPLYQKCMTDCPLECDTITYSIETSNANFPSDDYANRLKAYGGRNKAIKLSNLTVDTIKQNSLYVRVYYADLSYDSITQIPQITLDQLLGTIGGQLGLFIGISFLSFLELVEIVIEVLYVLIFTKDKIDKSQMPIHVKPKY
ncbi:hypothetical protein DAPPUDRAFT_343736 [Daphnia pulex]|uniref:Uncharacterized protein n=1 Tax=Daphnia pulex TaxID=6669 RepID=E9I6D2_DAPPU|nr:hypothetical protein DAPPUDRAFT_343736 [Daphnia pulex]|eukprot:EFX60448.1 hypothetical protein DAPPUDRAFT_343736 [Daphnia pulex]